VWYIWFW